ncbi:MAG: carbohydrate ABC transporter permease, partial [Clostridia bacterium]
MLSRAKGRRRKRLEGMDIVSAAVLTATVLVIAFPFYTALITSFTTNASYIRNPVQLIPMSFTLENYTYIFERMNILTGYQNTLFIALIGTAFSMLISLTYAYGLAAKDYPGKRLFFIYLLVTMYFGGGLIPTYLLIRDLGLVNNKMGIVFLCGVSPFYIIIIKNGLEQLPESLMESARVSGANEWQVFTHITIPLIMPIVVTFSLFIAVNYWNEWFWSMISLTRPAQKTLQVMLRTIVTTMETLEMDSAASDYAEVFTQGL